MSQDEELEQNEPILTVVDTDPIESIPPSSPDLWSPELGLLQREIDKSEREISFLRLQFQRQLKELRH